MAGGIDTGGDKKKSLDTSINLTPCIDLFAVMICFLIMTAVWTQIGRLQVAQAGGPSDPSEQTEENKTVPVTLLVTDKAIKLSVGQGVPEEFALVRAGDKNKLDLVKLTARADHLPDELSGGERQRVAIARALSVYPPILLADEPTGNLDTQTGLDILRLIRDLHVSLGSTILIVTHDMNVARTCQRTITIRDGRIVSDEPRDQAG